MVFSSLSFLCIFLPVVMLFYYLLPTLWIKNALLIVASLLFYAYGEPVYIVLMIFSTMINYLFGRMLETENYQIRRIVIVLSVIVNIGLLLIFKYTDMIIDTLNSILNTDIPLQIVCRKTDVKEIAQGVRRFIIGLSKKVLISNTAALAVDAIFSTQMDRLNILSVWIGAIAYLIQLYFDFSGYSDMAIGLGHMFGFHFLENFQYPYISSSIKEFWKRWHISLSVWFRQYLYIPLGAIEKESCVLV